MVQDEVGSGYWVCGREECSIAASECSYEDLERWLEQNPDNVHTRDNSIVTFTEYERGTHE